MHLDFTVVCIATLVTISFCKKKDSTSDAQSLKGVNEISISNNITFINIIFSSILRQWANNLSK